MSVTTRVRTRWLVRAGMTLAAWFGWMLVAMVSLHSCNPMTRVFVREYSIRNDSDQTLFVTPIATPNGVPAGSRERNLMPLYAGGVLLIPALHQWRFRVEAGETLSLLYDWDDFWPTEIVVELPDGQILQRPEVEAAGRIADLSSWGEVEEHIRPLVTGVRWRRQVVWLGFAGCALLAISRTVLRRFLPQRASATGVR